MGCDPAQPRQRRVVLISEAMSGGVREHILQLAFSLKQRRWDVRLVVGLERADGAFHAERPNLEKAGVPLYSLPMRHNAWAPGNLLSAFRLARLLRAWQPDVVHAHCAIAGAIGRVAAMLAGTKAIVYSPHGGSLHQVYGRLGGIYGAIERLLARRTGAIILISDWLRSRGAEVIRCSPEKMEVVPIGIDAGRFPPIEPEQRQAARSALAISPHTTVFLCVGLLRKIKGQDLLVRAFQRVWQRDSQSKLLLVGEGEMRSELEHLARRLGMTKAVQFTGFVDDVSTYLRAADVYVQPSRADASSYSVMEAMISSLPVVAAGVAALPEIVQDSATGFLVPAEDDGAMAAAMTLLADRPELRRKMGLAGRRRIIECFRSDEMVCRTEQVYRDCLGVENRRALPLLSKRPWGILR
jgi:glycosyltransferase involved in cell wall biosynthesis